MRFFSIKMKEKEGFLKFAAWEMRMIKALRFKDRTLECTKYTFAPAENKERIRCIAKFE